MIPDIEEKKFSSKKLLAHWLNELSTNNLIYEVRASVSIKPSEGGSFREDPFDLWRVRYYAGYYIFKSRTRENSVKPCDENEGPWVSSRGATTAKICAPLYGEITLYEISS